MVPARWEARVELKRAGVTVLDEEGVRILEAIRERGSIRVAAQVTGRSYAYVWRYLRRASMQLGYDLVETSVGGSEYGGAALTAEAKGLLDQYRRLRRSQGEALAREAAAGSKAPDLVVTGSDCPGVGLIAGMMAEKGVSCRALPVGSAAGLASLMLREADIVGLHLLDAETGQYNIPFLERFWLEDRTILFRGYRRQQGLIVRRGNPKEISGIDDLVREDVRLVNRQRGSGTRILLDNLLSKLAERRSISLARLVKSVRGYENEARSHSDVAAEILARRADVGLGIRISEPRLEFIPIHEELFDFAVDNDTVKRPEVRAFTQVLASREFGKAAEGLGIRTTSETGHAVYP